jgi:hypothetical protein
MNDTTDGGNKDKKEESTLDVVPIVPKRGRGRPKKIRKTVEELLLEASERLQRPVGGVSAPSIASKTPEKAPQSVEEVPADIQLAYETIQRSLRVIASRRANRDFLTYIRMMAPKVVDGFKMGRHIEVIAQKLQMVVDGKIKRLMVFLPPRSSKSVICSKLFPSWYIGRNPKHEIMTISTRTSWQVILVGLSVTLSICQSSRLSSMVSN